MDNEIIIRPVRISDVPEINAIRTMPGVMENIMSVPCERIDDTEEYIKQNKAPYLVAELGGHVVGMAGFRLFEPERMSHRAAVGLSVHRDFQGRGIGRVLLAELLKLADEWFMLRRLELEVFTDNERAIRLYESFGFVIEGTEKFAAVRNGRYEDMYLMARCRP